MRLGVDQWGSTGRENPEVTQPIQDLVAREAPDFDPYPWGRFDFVRTLVLNITLAQPLAGEYAELFRGLGEDELDRARGLVRVRATAASARPCATSSARRSEPLPEQVQQAAHAVLALGRRSWPSKYAPCSV